MKEWTEGSNPDNDRIFTTYRSPDVYNVLSARGREYISKAFPEGYQRRQYTASDLMIGTCISLHYLPGWQGWMAENEWVPHLKFRHKHNPADCVAMILIAEEMQEQERLEEWLAGLLEDTDNGTD